MTILAKVKENYEENEAQPSYAGCKLLTVDAVAQRLDVPKSTVYEAARQNRIGGVVRFGRIVRFDPERFEAWLEAGGQALPGGWRHEAA